MLARLKFEISELVQSMMMMDQVNPSIFQSPDSTFLDPAMGGGQFIFEAIKRLKEQGYSNANIKFRVFGFESNILYVNYVKERYIREFGEEIPATLRVGGFEELEALKMKFDIAFSNPPYNVSSGGSNGTGGNTTFYKRFRERTLSHLVPGGILLFVCPKGIIRDLYESPNQVETIDLMVDEEFWGFNTLYFVERNAPRISSPVFHFNTVVGSIITKMFCHSFNEWEFNEYSRSKKKIAPVYALVSLKNGGEYRMTDYALSPAPRFWCEKLTSKNYIAYDGYADPGISGYVNCSSLDDAERLKKFIENNRLPRFFQKKTKVKSLEKDFFRFTKRFELEQIETGSEYPIEYGLTDEEIRYIEEQVM